MALPIVDMESVMQRLDNDKEFLGELLNELLLQLDESLSEIRLALANSDFETLRIVAHGLKGASANLSVTPMTEIFKGIEERAKDHVTDEIPEMLEEVERLKADLKGFLLEF